MIKQLEPKYCVICDRCGKERYYYKLKDGAEEVVTFSCNSSVLGNIEKSGQVCMDCFKDFWQIAENFFDEANKRQE